MRGARSAKFCAPAEAAASNPMTDVPIVTCPPEARRSLAEPPSATPASRNPRPLSEPSGFAMLPATRGLEPLPATETSSVSRSLPQSRVAIDIRTAIVPSCGLLMLSTRIAVAVAVSRSPVSSAAKRRSDTRALEAGSSIPYIAVTRSCVQAVT